MNTIMEALERSRLEQANSDNLNKRLTKEIEEKSSEIAKLTEELADAKNIAFPLVENDDESRVYYTYRCSSK